MNPSHRGPPVQEAVLCFFNSLLRIGSDPGIPGGILPSDLTWAKFRGDVEWWVSLMRWMNQLATCPKHTRPLKGGNYETNWWIVDGYCRSGVKNPRYAWRRLVHLSWIFRAQLSQLSKFNVFPKSPLTALQSQPQTGQKSAFSPAAWMNQTSNLEQYSVHAFLPHAKHGRCHILGGSWRMTF